MIHYISRFIAALALILLTAQTAGAQTVSNVPYIDADGNEQTATYATVVTSDMGGTSADNFSSGNGWYYVNSDVTLNGAYNTATYTQNIILGDGATLTVSGRFRIRNASLNIYCQSGGTGRLVVSGSYGSGAIFSVTSGGTLTINGGTVEVTNTANNCNGFNGNLVMNGGTATFTSNKGVTCYAITGSVTLNGGTFTATSGSWEGVCDKTVTIGDGKYFKDGSGNIYYGTLTDAQNNALNGVTLSPATKTEYIQACLGTGNDGSASKPYTISDAAGWDAFCLALQDNDTWNRFSGKTVQLGDDITVTRMAGGSNHAFTGTFDGGDHTLTLAYGTADAPIDAQFVAPFVETAADGDHQPTFCNLTIDGTIYATHTQATDHDHVGGLIGHLSGTVTIQHCTSLVEIHAKGGAGGFVGLCEHSVSFTDCHSSAVIASADGSNSGFVAWSRDSKWNISFTGCLFDGKLLQQNGSGAYNGGFIGWKGDAKIVNITNCLVTPAPLADGEKMATDGSATFSREHSDHAATIKNSYYTQSLGDAQGKAITTHTVTAGTDVTIGAIALTGSATQYTVSGITAYSGGGLQRGQTLYYGIDDQLSLTLTTSAQCDQAGYQYAYTASAGTLSGSTLTMPDQDVTISVNTAELAPIDWATVNQGDSEEDPYMIYNKDQLLLLAHRVNGTNGETANDYQYKYFKLGADITFDHPVAEPDNYAENYEAIGGNIGGTKRYFYGNFDGDGHTVSGIRIRKTGSGDADCCQGLFGRIGGSAVIHDVHLTDARITGCANVGGIAGYNHDGYIMRCSVTDSYITATGIYYGTICGWNSFTKFLRNNYYHGCTVNGTAVTSGMGCNGADFAANHGAIPAYAITLGANITTPPGTFAGQTEWLDTPPVNPRLAPENGFTLAGNHYFASGYEFTPGSTLASGAAQGYTPRATLGGQLLELYTPTDNAPDYTGTAIARLTITAVCDGKTLSAALRSDGLEHEVSYMTADGTAQTAQAVALDGTETNLAAGWYFVGKDISYTATVTLGGDVHLILADGKTMNVTTTGDEHKDYCINAPDGHSLHIYGQTEGTGALNAQTQGNANSVIHIEGGTLGIHGGNVTATVGGTPGYLLAICVQRTTAGDALVIDRGNVTANGNNGCGISIQGGDAHINGGQVVATGASAGITVIDLLVDESLSIPGILTLSGGTLIASSFKTYSGASYAGTLAVASGLTYTDGTGLYDSTTETATLAALGGKTLQPCLVLNEADGVTALVGQTNKLVAFARTFSANVASTICLPFAISAEQATAVGKFYTFAGVDMSRSDWVVTMQEADPSNLVSGELAANTPYLFMPSSSSEVIFSGTIGNVADTYTAGTTTSGDWTYEGTYETIEWKTDPVNIYGFASGQAYGNSGDQTEAGKFIRVHTGGIRPFRAYLQYSGSGHARALSRSANDGLPETMTVRLIGSNGQTTAIGTLDTRTGDVTFGDEWYTLDGRRLPAKPTAKGLYINKGNKVFIK